jgi:hypothetical protein
MGLNVLGSGFSVIGVFVLDQTHDAFCERRLAHVIIGRQSDGSPDKILLPRRSLEYLPQKVLHHQQV